MVKLDISRGFWLNCWTRKGDIDDLLFRLILTLRVLRLRIDDIFALLLFATKSNYNPGGQSIFGAQVMI